MPKKDEGWLRVTPRGAALVGFLDAFVEIFNTCVKRGQQPPFILCAVGLNGSVLCIRIHDIKDAPDVLAEHYQDSTFQAPINCMVIDQTGEAACFIIPVEQLQFH
jgi:hypothetical protein